MEFSQIPSSTLLTTSEQLEEEILEIVESQLAVLDGESSQENRENVERNFEMQNKSLNQNFEKSPVIDETIVDSEFFSGSSLSIPKGKNLVLALKKLIFGKY